MPRPLHIAIVSTGRSGTTWLQLVLAHLYDAHPVGARDWDDAAGRFAPDVHNGLLYRLAHKHYDDFPRFWQTLPSRAVVHAHWHAYPAVVEALEARNLPTITVARHPLDVLISHLAWVNRNTTEDLGLDVLKGATPTSPAFLDFATGELAQWLLSITPGWWLRDVVRVRYEDLRAHPHKEVDRIATEIASRQAPLPVGSPRGSQIRRGRGAAGRGVKPPDGDLTPGSALSPRDIDQALSASDLRRLQSENGSPLSRLIPAPQRAMILALRARLRGDREAFVQQHRERKHFWQGQPGLWRSFLPAEHAERIAAAHQPSFDLFAYPIDPDPNLTPAQAEANWQSLL